MYYGKLHTVYFTEKNNLPLERSMTANIVMFAFDRLVIVTSVTKKKTTKKTQHITFKAF